MASAASALAAHLILTGRSQAAWDLVEKEGCWNSQLAAAAPSEGYETWARAMRARATRLAAGGHVHWSACHLLAVGDIWQAVQLYMRHGLHREALALARCRLDPLDPAFGALLDQLLLLLLPQSPSPSPDVLRPPPPQQQPPQQRQPPESPATLPRPWELPSEGHVHTASAGEAGPTQGPAAPAADAQLAAAAAELAGPAHADEVVVLSQREVTAAADRSDPTSPPDGDPTVNDDPVDASHSEAVATTNVGTAPPPLASAPSVGVSVAVPQAATLKEAKEQQQQQAEEEGTSETAARDATAAAGVGPEAAVAESPPQSCGAAAAAPPASARVRPAPTASDPLPPRSVPPEAMALQGLLAGKPLLAAQALRAAGTSSALSTAALLCAQVARSAGATTTAAAVAELSDPWDAKALEGLGRGCAADALPAVYREALLNVVQAADGGSYGAVAAAAVATEASCRQVQSAAAAWGGARLAGCHCAAGLLAWCVRRALLERPTTGHGGSGGGCGGGDLCSDEHAAGEDSSAAVPEAGPVDGPSEDREYMRSQPDTARGGADAGTGRGGARGPVNWADEYDEDDEMALLAVNVVYLGRGPRPGEGGSSRRKVAAVRRPRESASASALVAAAPGPLGTGPGGFAGANTAERGPPTRGAEQQPQQQQLEEPPKPNRQTLSGSSENEDDLVGGLEERHGEDGLEGVRVDGPEGETEVARVCGAAAAMWESACTACGVSAGDAAAVGPAQAAMREVAAAGGALRDSREGKGTESKASSSSRGGAGRAATSQGDRSAVVEAVSAMEVAICDLVAAVSGQAAAAAAAILPSASTAGSGTAANSTTPLPAEAEVNATAGELLAAARRCAALLPPLPPAPALYAAAMARPQTNSATAAVGAAMGEAPRRQAAAARAALAGGSDGGAVGVTDPRDPASHLHVLYILEQQDAEVAPRGCEVLPAGGAAALAAAPEAAPVGDGSGGRDDPAAAAATAVRAEGSLKAEEMAVSAASVEVPGVAAQSLGVQGRSRRSGPAAVVRVQYSRSELLLVRRRVVTGALGAQGAGGLTERVRAMLPADLLRD